MDRHLVHSLVQAFFRFDFESILSDTVENVRELFFASPPLCAIQSESATRSDHDARRYCTGRSELLVSVDELVFDPFDFFETTGER